MTRIKTILSLLSIICLVGAVAAQQQNRGKAEATVNGKNVSVNYGRPSLKGRDMLGMASVGTVWRVGMNQATEIESTGKLIVAGKELAPGKYSLWAKKTGTDSWILGFSPKTGVWGAPPITEGYVAELPLKLEKASDAAEQLTITLTPENNNCTIRIHWGTSVLAGSFGVQ